MTPSDSPMNPKPLDSPGGGVGLGSIDDLQGHPGKGSPPGPDIKPVPDSDLPAGESEAGRRTIPSGESGADGSETDEQPS
ncbi:hypothetical protein [Methylobacterium nigriterrae]|uniref:hypothetical protein n=1 Tax=Methylobacterium nigriterrae TaxID=3127512 RepID=UPI003013392C